MCSSACRVKLKEPVIERLTVDDHDLVMGDGMLAVDEYGKAVVGQEIGLRIVVADFALVEDDVDHDAALMGPQQGLGNVPVRETVGLDEDGLLGRIQGPYHGLGGAAFGREVDVNGRQGTHLEFAAARQGRQEQECRHDALHISVKKPSYFSVSFGSVFLIFERPNSFFGHARKLTLKKEGLSARNR